MAEAFEPEEFKGMLYHDGVDSQGRPVIVVNTDAVGTGRKARSQAMQHMLHRLEPIVTQVSQPSSVVVCWSGCWLGHACMLRRCRLVPWSATEPHTKASSLPSSQVSSTVTLGYTSHCILGRISCMHATLLTIVHKQPAALKSSTCFSQVICISNSSLQCIMTQMHVHMV